MPNNNDPHELLPVLCPVTHTASPLSNGRLRIQILNCFLNVKVKRPYVILTLGDQRYQTSVSEFREGRWNEYFEFIVTFHVQLFGTIQLDLYDNYTIYPDKHVGRTEIRLSTLTTMPETFMSYYEIWDKKLSTGASSSIGRERAGVNNVGALQIKISYQFQKPLETSNKDQQQQEQLLEKSIMHDLPVGSTNLMTEEQLAAELKRHLQFHRERKKANKGGIRFKKYEENEDIYNQGLDYPDESDLSEYDEYELHSNHEDVADSLIQPLKMSKKRVETASYHRNKLDDDDEFGEMIAAPELVFKQTSSSSWFNFSSTKDKDTTTPMNYHQETKRHPVHKPDNGNIRTLPEDNRNNKKTIDHRNWDGPAEISQVIKSIGKLLASFGQGFELTHMQVITGFTVLEKFYADLPRNRTWDLVENLSEIDMGARFWKFSIASYGWKGLNFIGKGNGIFSDAIREHSDARSIIEYLAIPKEDLLAYEFRSAEAFRPSYFIARDRFTNSIVLSIRGTMSVMDTLTDLVCEYEPWKGGFIHSGMKNSAIWFLRHVAPQLIAYTNEHSTTGLIIVGHSLGGATAAILTIMLMDYIDEFRKGKDEFKLQCFGYAPACGLSLDLAEKYKDIIQSYIFADDIVSKLSYGSMMDVKDLIIASSEAVRNMGVGEILWSSDPDGQKWKAAFKQIAQVRERCLKTMENPRLYVAGQIYQFWLDPTPSNDTRIVVEKTNAITACNEVVVKKSILLDHLPTNFDIAFRRARETLMMEGGSSILPQTKKPSAANGVLDPTITEEGGLDDRVKQAHQEDQMKEDTNQSLWDTVAKLSLKGTTDRTGGDGKVIGHKASR
ncbi:uncharacterized protein BX663DRAFT_505867 [Cokeromyces recurvatus]|uniref:uncharacterized protein n=1 Tax=Cokeromyces recurvatus TaxID=90255 RepID=UPI0022201C57|nr:uncharacterized protein BX663DRAFT_505867 [Cokeromyces recurvatus]KAI7903957.1 hypothetical protein BX663DRAFT_505867 [Cokeromyces recurvatus]